MTGPQPESLVSIVMVNWHSSALVKKCLESVASSPGIIKYIQEIIIVDNSSGDRGLASIRCGEVAIHHMHNTANVGFGRACNQGGAISKGKYLLFLNPDTELNQNSLRIPFEFLDSRENLNYAACGLQLRSDNDEVARTCTYLPSAYSFAIGALGIAHVMPFVDDRFHMLSWPHDSDKDVAHIIGAFYLIRAHIFKDIGGFDERFIVYLEDLDLSARLASAGWKIRYLASATISHVGGGTSSKILPARLYYSLSSRLRYSRKHHSAAAFFMIACLTMLVEPFIRVLHVIFVKGISGVNIVAKAYVWLWVDLLRTGAGATAAAAR